MGLYEKLSSVQEKLKVPKNNFNGFGKYNYRSCEDILAAAKPILKENKLAIALDDEIITVNGSNYVKAKAIIIDTETGEMFSVCSNARESVEKKGMDDSQITGTASSYARKYALNGLFGLDDTKDADSEEYQNENHSKSQQQTKYQSKEVSKPGKTDNNRKVSPSEATEIRQLCEEYGKKEIDITSFYKVKAIEEMTLSNYEHCLGIFKKIKGDKNE